MHGTYCTIKQRKGLLNSYSVPWECTVSKGKVICIASSDKEEKRGLINQERSDMELYEASIIGEDGYK